MSDWDDFDDIEPITPLGNGRFLITLSDEERSLLANLPAEIVEQIEADDERSTYRLFPPGYSEDLGRQVEYDRLMRDDLQASHIGTLNVLAETATATELDEEQLNAWIKALNQIRLVLGTKLDVDEDTTFEDLPPDDPRTGAWALYLYLGHLQESGVEALSEALP